MSPNIKKIIEKSQNPQLIGSAFEFAKDGYKDKFRLSGENYLNHAIRVAANLESMGLDPITVTLGIFHDLLDDIPDSAKNIELREIEKKFGKEVSGLLEKISELNKIRYSLSLVVKERKNFAGEKIENLRRMFLALSSDLRVIIVELVSRLDGLNFLQYLPEEKQKVLALETLQILVPVASRLGLSEIRRNLEDKAFLIMAPDKFQWLKDNIKEQYEERERYLKKFIPRLKRILKKEGVKNVEVNYRTKSYWSTFKKLTTHGMDLNKVRDLLALRIITQDIPSCYRILGVVHKYFKPISEEINDYIAKPKPNGYRSLHTTILLEAEKIVEVQIRTEEMHKEAEYGVCAHWSYKEKIDLTKEGRNFEWLKDTPDFWKTFKLDLFPTKIFCFTPKGDVIVLPKNSTPVDFAYAIHSTIGNHCESAKLNGKIVPLNFVLGNGDIVEITTNKNRSPSRDWLKFVKSSLAKSHIRKFTEQEKPVSKFSIPGFIKRKIVEITGGSKKRAKENKREPNIKQIYLAGQKGILIHIAKCCNPKSDDRVVAYLAQNRSAVLHKADCLTFKKISQKFPEKIIEAYWK